MKNKAVSFIQTIATYWQCVFLYNIKKKFYTRNLPQQKKNGISPYSVPFLFSTENLIDTYRAVPPSGKNVLTVAASGDHAFDAYLCGARHVKTFDYNQWQECVLCLKTDMIHHMNYNQFMTFFTAISDRNIHQSYDILSPVVPYLSSKAKILVDKFYNPKTNIERFFQISPFFWTNYGHYKQNKIGYLQSRTAFNKLKKSLPEQIDFTLADADTMAKNVRGHFDIIHLSNIMDYYAPTDTFADDAARFYDNVLNPFFGHLNNNGKIVMDYDYGNKTFELPYSFYYWFHKIIIDNSHFGANQDVRFTSVNIPAIQNDSDKNTLWMLQKTR